MLRAEAFLPQVTRFMKRFFIAAAIIISLCLTQRPFFQALVTQQRIPIETWNIFHYYLNAKYYSELRYTDLYACAIEADRGRNQVYLPTMVVRNLVDYTPVEVAQYPPCPRDRFTPKRWANLVTDVVRLQQAPAYLHDVYHGRLDQYLNNILTDKGYNLPPTYVGISKLFITVTNGLGSAQFVVLASLDALLLIAAFIVVGRTFGKASAITGALFTLWFWGSEGFLLGQFLQHAWLAFILFSLCAFEKQKWKQSGVWWALAVMTRIFPMFLLIPLVPFALHLRTRDRQNFEQFKVFGLAFVVSCFVLGLIGCFAGLGVEGWWLFFQKMQIHSHYLTGELFDIGFKNLLATFAGGTATDLERLAFFDHFNWLWLIPSLVASVFIRWQVRRVRSALEAILLGLPLAYLWIVVSPYYLLSLVIVPIVLLKRNAKLPPLCLASLFAITFVHLILGWSGIEYASANQPMHFWSEWLIFGFMILLTATVLPKSLSSTHDAVSNELRS